MGLYVSRNILTQGYVPHRNFTWGNTAACRTLILQKKAGNRVLFSVSFKTSLTIGLTDLGGTLDVKWGQTRDAYIYTQLKNIQYWIPSCCAINRVHTVYK